MKENCYPRDTVLPHGGYNASGYLKERKVALIYKQATDRNVQIFDCNFRPLEVDGVTSIEYSICRYCAGDDGSCHEMHVNAIRDSGRRGSSCVYQCELGLVFWVSPIYNECKFTGALRGSGCLYEKREVTSKCNGIISPEEFTRRVSAFPISDPEEIQSLAEMLLLCAESLSRGRANHHEALRVRSRQQASITVLIEELKVKYPEGSVLPGYPLDKERQLIASLHRGDKKGMERILNEVLAILIYCNPNHFRYIQLRALELAVLLTRAGVNSSSNIAMENNTRYLKQIQEAKSIEELTGTLHSIVENIAGQITPFQGIPHALAMRKAEIFIRENLTRKINLRDIARVVGLSGPYFSTIFKEEMGENLSRYVNRLRVEKASKMLLETNLSLSEISSACCFEDQSWFSKIFKSFTGISPGKYRSQGGAMIQEISESNLSETLRGTSL